MYERRVEKILLFWYTYQIKINTKRMAEGTIPAPESEKKPSMPMAQSAGLNEDSKNVFTELFGKDVSQKAPTLMNTVAVQQEKKNSFFGEKPKTDDLLSLKKLRAHPSRPGAAVLNGAFLALMIVGALSLSQNSTHFSLFGVNAALQVEQGQDSVNSLSAEVDFQTHLEAALLLDEYMSKADEYFYNVEIAESDYTSSNKKAAAESEADSLRIELTTLLGTIQNDFQNELTPEALLAAQVEADTFITELSAKQGTVDESILLQDIQDAETAKNLLSQSTFKNTVKSIDLAQVSNDDFYLVYTEFSVINSSVTALVSKIKNARIDWSFYFDEIESLTKSVDPLFATEFPGSLTLDELRFSSTGEVALTGETATDDSKNFTLISDLIDAYEASDAFSNVENRTYAKSGEEEETYTGNFRINLILEQ